MIESKGERKKIAIVECTDAGGIEIGMAVLQMGYTPLFLLNPDSYKGDIGIYLQHYEFLTVDTLSADAIYDALSDLRENIAGITTLVDSRLAITAQAASKLGVPGPDPACIILKDKAEVARMCPNHSLKTIECLDVLNGVFDIKNDDKSYVAKTKSGCGAVGIEFLHSKDAKRTICERLPNPSDWILQEYFDGKLYSMEGWVDTYGIHYLGWTSRRKIRNTETEFRFEGFNTLPDEITKFAKDAISTLFTSSMYQRGWFHIEFLVNEDKSRAVMIDANVGRTGGAMLPHVISMAFSLRPKDIYQHAIEMQIFGSSNISIPEENSHLKIFKCVCFGSGYSTIIDQVILPDYPLKNPGLRVVRILGAGDRVNHMGVDDWSWVGFVAGLEDDVDQYASKIKIKNHNGQLYSATF